MRRVLFMTVSLPANVPEGGGGGWEKDVLQSGTVMLTAPSPVHFLKSAILCTSAESSVTQWKNFLTGAESLRS